MSFCYNHFQTWPLRNYFIITFFPIHLELKQQIHSYITRAVKKFLSRRLIMNSRRLWNSHQRNKFVRAKAARDTLTYRVTEIAFPGVFKRHFPPQTPCCFVRIHTGLGTMPSGGNVSGVLRHRTVYMFHRSKLWMCIQWHSAFKSGKRYFIWWWRWK